MGLWLKIQNSQLHYCRMTPHEVKGAAFLTSVSQLRSALLQMTQNQAGSIKIKYLFAYTTEYFKNKALGVP